MPGRLTLNRGKLFRRLGENVFPRKKFPRVERAITRGLVRQTRPRSLSGQWINEKLTLRRQMFAFYGQKLHGYSHALEQRADVVLMRSGLSPTLAAARQRINHRHVMLNQEAIRSPSVRIEPGEVLFVAPILREERSMPRPEDGAEPAPLSSKLRYAQLLWASLWSEQSAATHSLLRSLFPSLQFSPGTKTLQDELDTGVGGAASMLIKPQPAPKGPRIVLDGQVQDHVDLDVASSGEQQRQTPATAFGRRLEAELQGTRLARPVWADPSVGAASGVPESSQPRERVVKAEEGDGETAAEAGTRAGAGVVGPRRRNAAQWYREKAERARAAKIRLHGGKKSSESRAKGGALGGRSEG